LGRASGATVGRATGLGANGFSTGSSPASRSGLNAGLDVGANGLTAGSSSSSPRANGFRGRRGAGAAGANALSQEARAAFEPRSASSQ
jgi:hypothetical protein